MNLTKGTLQLTILLGVVILILVGIGGYLVWQVQKQPTPTPPSSSIPPTITPPTPPQPPVQPQTSLKLLYPKGGEVWKEGETYKIKWESKGVKKVNIEYGDGKSYFIVQDYPADKGEYEWTPQGIVEQYEGFVMKPLAEIQIKISVWDAENPNLYDKSDDITLISQETADWKTYRNEEYGFEFRYPQEWYESKDIEEWLKKETEKDGKSYPPEGIIVFTKLTQYEEQEYLKMLNSYDGIGSAFDHIKYADGRLIVIQIPYDPTIPQKSFSTAGYEILNWRKETNENNVEIIRYREIITWEMSRDYEVAWCFFSSPKKIHGRIIKGIKLKIERNEGNYDKEAFETILSTFKFIQ